ncbi:MAG: Smr/MutS family protein, partial [Clostridia bacterium]|nr:Smr/MutS family protein [Clostridia bacterium]
PGKSNAFAISKRLGLSEEILEKASSYLSAEDVRFEDVISDMEEDIRNAREERELSKKMLLEASDTKKRIEDEQKKLEDKKDAILLKAKEQARDILLEAEEEANEIIKELTLLKSQKQKDDRNKRAEENRKKLKKSISEIQKDLTIPKKEVKNSLDPNDVTPGEKFYIPSLDQEVTAISRPDKKGNVMVQSGIIKLTTHISQLEKINMPQKEAKVAVNSYVKSKAQTISSEINLLGNTVDEAIETLDKYLDDAYLSGVGQVRIVHGKGSGALRNGIHQYLKKHPHVKSYRLGVYGEGDSGVTIVELN